MEERYGVRPRSHALEKPVDGARGDRTDNRSRSPGCAASSGGGNAAKGSRQIGSVTSGEGVALGGCPSRGVSQLRTGTDQGILTV